MINFNKKDSVASTVDSILKKEEVEQLDELKKSTLSSYVKKAAKDTAVHGFAIGDSIANKKWKTGAKAGDMADKRIKGIGKATDRLAKEEVEQIDELSKSTLGSYVKKATTDAVTSRKLAADFEHKSERAKNVRTKGAASRLSRKFMGDTIKRKAGIDKAVNRLTKEDTEQVDEALKGDQHKIDKNKNNKIDAHDFKILRGKKSLKKFKEDYDENSIIDQMISEVLSKDASAGDWIHDFVHSDNPKFAGKSKAKRKEMALGAYYKKQNEEVESVDEALKGDQHKIDKNKNKKIDAEDFKLLRKEDAVQEGWDDMVKSATEKVKSGPKPSGGSGIKQGTRYGGGKQKDEPEKKEVKEAKQPDQDNVPFAPPYNTSSSPANVKDKSGAVHTPMSRVKHIARQAMKKVKSNLGK